MIETIRNFPFQTMQAKTKEAIAIYVIFFFLPIALIALTLYFCAPEGIFRSQYRPEPSDAEKYLGGKHFTDGPGSITEKDWNKFLKNVPQESREKIIEKIHRSGNDWYYDLLVTVKALTDYPLTHDPAKKEAYWKQSTKEVLLWLDMKIEKNDVLSERDGQELSPDETAALEERKTRFRKSSPFLPYLTLEQKDRLRNGLLIFENPVLSAPPDISIESVLASWRSRHNPAQEYMFELRDEALAVLRADETPELEALRLTVSDLQRWDGSTSLKPLAKIIAAHAAGLPWKWEGGFSRVFGFGHENEIDLHAIPENADTVHLDRDRREEYYSEITTASLSFSQRDAGDTPSLQEPPNVAFFDAWKFSKTHQAIVNVIEGHRDLALVSRKPSPDEWKLAKEKNVELELYPFAKDGFVFIKNRGNPIENLTLDQVRGIFSGKIKTWKKVGGKSKAAVIPFVRNRNSGSEELMRELVMKNIKISSEIPQISQSMEGVYDFMEVLNHGIGYTIHYYDRYMVCSPYTRTLRINGVEATPETIADGSYSLIYECVAVVRKDGPDRAKDVVRWLSGAEGAKIVRESGYVPIRIN